GLRGDVDEIVVGDIGTQVEAAFGFRSVTDVGGAPFVLEDRLLNQLEGAGERAVVTGFAGKHRRGRAHQKESDYGRRADPLRAMPSFHRTDLAAKPHGRALLPPPARSVIVTVRLKQRGALSAPLCVSRNEILPQ